MAQKPFFSPPPATRSVVPMPPEFLAELDRLCQELRQQTGVDAVREERSHQRYGVSVWPKYRGTQKMLLVLLWWDGSHLWSMLEPTPYILDDAKVLQQRLEELVNGAQFRLTLETFRDIFKSSEQGMLRLADNPGRPSPDDVLVIVDSGELESIAEFVENTQPPDATKTLTLRLPEDEPMGRYLQQSTYRFLVVETYAVRIAAHCLMDARILPRVVELEIKRVD